MTSTPMPGNLTSGRLMPPGVMNVLLIADDPEQARHFAALLGTLGFPEIALDSVAGLAAASEHLSAHSPDVILLDLALPEAEGLDGLLRVSAESSAPIVVLAGDRQRELGARALRHGAHAHLQKDQLDGASLLRALRRASGGRSRSLTSAGGISADSDAAHDLARVISYLERSNDAIFGLTLEGVVTRWNVGAERLYGRSAAEVIGRPIMSLVTPECVAEWSSALQAIRMGEPLVHRETAILRQEGERTDAMLLAAPVRGREGGMAGAFAMVWEISERKSTQEEYVADRLTLERKLRQAQKMEVAGRLAGGLAHDFNNVLGVIIGYSDMLLDQIAPADAGRRQLEEIRKAGDRAASLARQFLAFSREEFPESRILDLNTIITDLEGMLRRLIREDIELLTVLAPGIGQIESDQGQIEQVIINLVVNARDAMPEGGKLILETFNVDLNEVYALHHPPLLPGPYVCLAVADTGVGMNSETQAHIFDPFFTTKPKGCGTGLGLATVSGVVKQNSGYVWVYSEPGMGATFKVYLPRVGDLAQLSPGARQIAALPRRSETILLVEDEPALRTVTCAMLEKGGYSVLEAANAAEAMAVAEQHTGQIDLLLTDVIMPGMNGPALAAKMARSWPHMKVLFISGYTGSYVAHRGLIEGSSLLLQKPFTPEALLRKLQEVLDSSRSPGAILETETRRD